MQIIGYNIFRTCDKKWYSSFRYCRRNSIGIPSLPKSKRSARCRRSILSARDKSAPRRIERLKLIKFNEEFEDFPKDQALETFDRSDRKFVALALKVNAVIANAVDSDWLEHRGALLKNGVRIRFICSINSSKWFARLLQNV